MMARLRPYAPALLAAVLQIFLLSRLRLLGLCPPLVPAAVFLSGTEGGADRGAAAGLLAGGVLFLAGGSPWTMALFAALGGLAGAWVTAWAGFFGLWLRFIPLAAAMEGGLVLVHWPARSALEAAWTIAGPELLLTVLCFPAAALLLGLFRSRRARPMY